MSGYLIFLLYLYWEILRTWVRNNFLHSNTLLNNLLNQFNPHMTLSSSNPKITYPSILSHGTIISIFFNLLITLTPKIPLILSKCFLLLHNPSSKVKKHKPIAHAPKLNVSKNTVNVSDKEDTAVQSVHAMPASIFRNMRILWGK